ncbi:MAG TPA: hypothetical protein VF160_00475 [Candidatus Dormibacteraeota bacterium]
MLLLLAGCGNPVTAPRAAAATAAPTAAPAATYTCADLSGGGSTRSNVVAVRAAAQDGFDRWVLEFDGPVPGYTITRQANASFTEDASGRTLTLDGSAGVVVRLQPASSGAQAPLAVAPRGTELRDLRRTGDFEGVVHWAAGLAAPACMHVTTLDGPPRLVIDFQTGS